MATEPALSRIPVTVLGGYLGSGKTTIINRLLGQIGEISELRVAVLVNDFGSINIDAKLIASQTDSVIELSNGCICCSLADGFAATLDQIRHRAQANAQTAPRQLLIETSGVALPGAVAQYAHMPGFELGSIIVVADGEQVTDQLADRYIGETVKTQLGQADLVLLSKTDLISAGEANSAAALIRSLSPATIIPVSSQQTAATSYDLPTLFFGPVTQPRSSSLTTPKSNPDSNLAIELAEIRLAQPVERAALERWLLTAPPGVVRIKGLLQCEADLLRVDRVGSRVQIQKQHDPVEPEIVGALVILSIGTADTEIGHPFSLWMAESPQKL